MSGPVGTLRSGKGSRVQVNGTNMTQAEYSVKDGADKLDTTNFESTGLGQSTIGIEELDYNVRGNWDATIRPTTSDPPGIFPRDNLLNVKIYTNLTDNNFWNIPQSTVVSAETTSQVRQLVGFNWAAFSNGTGWARP